MKTDRTGGCAAAIAPYYYPTMTDCRVCDEGSPLRGNFGPRHAGGPQKVIRNTRIANVFTYQSCMVFDSHAGPQMNALRDIDDWEMYFAFGLSSRSGAADKDAYTEDYIYVAFDDQVRS